MELIRVLVVDDHPIVRQGLRSVLLQYEDIQLVGEAGSAASAVDLALALHPDIVLLDIRMPGAHGVRVIRQLKAKLPTVKVIILTTFDEDQYLLDAIKEGADGYLLKTLSAEQLVAAIRDVNAGERLVSQCHASRLIAHFKVLARDKTRYESGLTERDLEILREMAGGATNREIAEKLFWSEVTVKRKVGDILSKLGASNRTQAVAEAMKRGLV